MKKQTGVLNKENILSFLSGSVDGYEYGYGEGYANGHGYEYGNGYGEGIGYGNGRVYADGYGDGNGDGYGNGHRHGEGGVDGYGEGNGYGHTIGCGSGDNDGVGYGDGNYSYIIDGLYKIDGILCSFINIKGDYAKIFVIDIYNSKNCRIAYLAKDGNGNFAHGNTLKEARESLIYKLTDRDIGIYKDWKLTDIKTKTELIQAYRVITGACEFGTRQFCQSVKLPEKATINEAIKLTQGQYGNEEFASFFINNEIKDD